MVMPVNKASAAPGDASSSSSSSSSSSGSSSIEFSTEQKRALAMAVLNRLLEMHGGPESDDFRTGNKLLKSILIDRYDSASQAKQVVDHVIAEMAEQS